MKQSYSFLAVCLFAFSALIYSNCSEPDTSRSEPSSVVEASAESDFLGDQACMNCHKEEYDQWQGSHHDLAMVKANKESVWGDFGGVSLENKGVTSRFFMDGDKFMVNTQGEDSNYYDYEVLYTFGAEPLQQYLVAFPGGKLQALRTAWDSKNNKWFHLNPDLQIDPKEWLHWSQGAMTWNKMCADCHSTNLAKNFDPVSETYHTSYDIINVSCEACHGSGKDHLAYIQTGKHSSAASKVEGAHLRLTPGQVSSAQVDQCAPCHSRRSSLKDFSHDGSFMDHYMPEIIREPLYHPDGQIRDEVYVYGSFVQSKMYHNDVKCTDCHNPHTLKLKFEGNQLCLQCHEPETFDTQSHHFHTLNTESSKCINCHMDGKLYMVNDYRRDHSFRIPRPDQSVAYGTPNACNSCHTDKDAKWAAKAVENWYGSVRPEHFSDKLLPAQDLAPEALSGLVSLATDTTEPAMARATAVYNLRAYSSNEALVAIIKALKDSAALVRIQAINSLNGLSQPQRAVLIGPLLEDSMLSVRITAANVLADVPENLLATEWVEPFRKAQREFKASLDMQADFRNGQMLAAQYFVRTGRQGEAEQAYKKVLEMDYLFNSSRMNLATMYNEQGRNEEAIFLLKTVIEQEPEVGEAYYSLGLLQAEEQQLDAAAENLGKAARLVGNNARIYYNWGLSLQHLERRQEAEQAYLEGLEVDPENESIHNALVIFYIQLKDPKKAKPHIEFLYQRYPNNPQIKQMYDEIRNLPG